MAKRTCPACGAPAGAGDEFCGFCGSLIPRNEAAAQSATAVQTAPAAESGQPKRRVQTPQTIDELLAFCERHELPLSKMRFFIGLDYPGAKAYGIYQDKNGDFVVYKNKADGSRAVRYRGPDEAYAVNELFQKLKEEATSQRARKAGAAQVGYPASSAHESNPYNYSNGETSLPRTGKRKPNKLLIGIIALAAAITIGRTAAAINQTHHPSTGYYQYNGNTYYSQNDNWYLYDSYGGWYPIYSVEDELLNNSGDYYTSYSYDEDYGVESFADSQYYSSYDYSSGSSYSDSDSSWSWDWDDDDSWDSSDDWDWDSDWDSDWGDWDSDW